MHIITGHAKQNGQLNLDFEALVRHRGTLVFLMSVSSTPMILSGLMQAGMAEDMPAAMIERGTLPTQRKLVATVGTLTRRMQEEHITSPAILIVGAVCALSDSFDWFSRTPLHGVTVAVTRPKNRAGTLTDKLRALGAHVISYPCIETKTIWPNMPVVEALASIDQYSWLVLTSPTGVETLIQLLDAADMDMRNLAHMKIAVIGSATAKALKAHGLRADYIPAIYDSVHLAEGLVRLVGEGDRVLLLRAAQGSAELPVQLGEACIPFDDVPIYETLYYNENSADMAQALSAGEIDYVTFTSASTVRGFVSSLPEGTDVSGFRALCIGAMTEQAAKSAGMQTITATSATIDAMLSRLLEEQQL